jgi:hypothetical protein
VSEAAEPVLPIEGGCMCGAVRREVREPLVGALYCHWKRCQRRTGSAFSVTALTTPGSFEITRGEDAVRSWQPAGDGWVKSFCSSCGSQAYTSHPDNPELISVRMGALDEDPGIRPSAISSSTTPLPGTAFRMTGFPFSRAVAGRRAAV